MRKVLAISLLVAATLVTATLASPAPATPLDPLARASASLQSTAVTVTVLFVWLIAAVALTIATPRAVRYSSVEVRVSPLHCVLVGLVAVTSFMLTAIAFNYLAPYGIGTPLLIALGVFAILTKIYGLIAVFHAVGTKVAGIRTIDQLATQRWLRGDIAMVVTGLLILGTIRLVPIAGPIVWGGASVFGVGVALATQFGRREPWFLAYRSQPSF